MRMKTVVNHEPAHSAPSPTFKQITLIDLHVSLSRNKPYRRTAKMAMPCGVNEFTHSGFWVFISLIFHQNHPHNTSCGGGKNKYC